MMGPNIQDICFLTGLRTHRIEANCFLSQKTLIFTYPTEKTLTYANFVVYYHGEGDVTKIEHVAFLIYWLNKFIFCVSFGKITKDFTVLAKTLASSQQLSMAPLVLAFLYRGMHDLLDKKFVFAAGPLWIMTLWLWAYFPRVSLVPTVKTDISCHGLRFQGLKPKDHTFDECFRFFYSDLK